MTHSNALYKDREAVLRDFAKFASEKELDGKLNQLMTAENIRDFLSERTVNLAASTAETYARTLSGLIQGLESTQVNIPNGAKDAVDSFVRSIDHPSDIRDGRYITQEDRAQIVERLEKISEASAVVARIQIETGLRTAEAIRVAENPERYLRENHLEGVVGKGGQEYRALPISQGLAQTLEVKDYKPVSVSTYSRDFREARLENEIPHDLRLSHIVDQYNSLVESGVSHSDAARETAEAHNHHREEITEHYLKGA
ncbi:MAG: hypothetical protein ABWK02_06155 [Aquificaceae bacterium]